MQEAVTSTIQHAAGAKAAISLAYGDCDLQAEVTDAGGADAASIVGTAAASANCTGHGLLCPRQRLRVYSAAPVMGAALYVPTLTLRQAMALSGARGPDNKQPQAVAGEFAMERAMTFEPPF